MSQRTKAMFEEENTVLHQRIAELEKQLTQQTEETIDGLVKFPFENPKPVLWVDQEGVILYANDASTPLLRDWGCSVGDQVHPSGGSKLPGHYHNKRTGLWITHVEKLFIREVSFPCPKPVI